MAIHYNIPKTARGGNIPWSDTVRDTYGKPLSGVVCRVDDLYENETGSDGRVLFMLDVGPHTAVFSHPAYRFNNPVSFEVK